MSTKAATYHAFQHKTHARVGTGVFLLLVLLLMFALKCEEPIPTESEGILVNFGTTETGSTNDIPTVTEVQTPSEVQPEESVVEEVVEEVETQEIEETVTIETSEQVEEVVEEPTEPVVEETVEEVVEEPTVNDNAMFGQSSVTNNNANNGNTDGSGDQGNPDGSIESDIYGNQSTGLGDSGFGWSLDGRSLVTAPQIKDNSQQTGTVKIKIKVNKQGKVVEATFTNFGSTTTDSHLVGKAIEAAKRAQFNIADNAPEIQQGTFTFVFKVQ